MGGTERRRDLREFNDKRYCRVCTHVGDFMGVKLRSGRAATLRRNPAVKLSSRFLKGVKQAMTTFALASLGLMEGLMMT